MTKADKLEQQEAIDQLRQWLKPGDTVYTILDHVSRSGMSRQIRVCVPYTKGLEVKSVPPGGKPTDYIRKDSVSVDFIHPNWAVGKALGLRHGRHNGHETDGLVIGGCGMDMGFHLVYQLSSVLYGKGYACLGKEKSCPSNYHRNHRSTIQCPGTVVYNPDGPNTGEPCRWQRGRGWVIHEQVPGDPGEVCPTCKGEGALPNPEGPERFDLVHTDGYALHHRWL